MKKILTDVNRFDFHKIIPDMYPRRRGRDPRLSRRLLADFRAGLEGQDGGPQEPTAPQVPDDTDVDYMDGLGPDALDLQADQARTEISDQDILDRLVRLYARHKVSQRCMDEVVNLVNDVRLQAAPLPRFKSMKKRAVRDLPRVVMDIEYLDKAHDALMLRKDQSFIPAALVNNTSRYQIQSVNTRVSASDIRRLHESMHETSLIAGETLDVRLSFDDVPIDKSSGRSFTVTSMQVVGCSQVYPLIVYHPYVGVKQIVDRTVHYVREDLADGDFRVKAITADLPKRADLQGLKRFGGYFCCPYCLVEGVRSEIAETVNYPCTYDEVLRTHEQMKATADALARDEIYDDEDCKGVMRPSPFFAFPDFDVVHQFPVDIMHNAFMGVVKRMFNLTFKTNDKRYKGFRRQRMNLARFNKDFRVLRVPSEQTRKPRPYSVHWKAAEYKALCLMHFPFLVDTLDLHPDPGKKLLQDIWSLIGYIIHCLYLPQDAVGQLSFGLEPAMREFTGLYEDYMGPEQFQLNVHLFSHLPGVHARWGPVSEYSAFPFENMYRLLLNGITPGTRSLAKQGVENVMLDYASRIPHRCQHSLRFQDARASDGRSQDHYVHDKEGQTNSIEKAPAGDETRFKVKKILVKEYRYVTNFGTLIPFGEIGISLKHDRVNHSVMYLADKDIAGKSIVTDKYVINLPKSVFQETSF